MGRHSSGRLSLTVMCCVSEMDQTKTDHLGFVFFQLPCPTGEVSTCVFAPGRFGQLDALLCVRFGLYFYFIFFFPLFSLCGLKPYFCTPVFGASSIFREQVLSRLRWTAHASAGALHLCTHFLCVIVALLLKLHFRDLLSKFRKQPESK